MMSYTYIQLLKDTVGIQYMKLTLAPDYSLFSLPTISVGYRAWALTLGPKLTTLNGRAWKDISLFDSYGLPHTKSPPASCLS